MSNEANSKPDDFPVVKPFKPQHMLEGVSVAEIKTLPAVKKLLAGIVAQEKERAYQEGFERGLEDGKAKAFAESKADFDSRFEEKLSSVEGQLSEVIDALKKPVPVLQERIIEDLKHRFHSVLLSLVNDTSVYDDSVLKHLENLVESLPSNNQMVRICLRSDLDSNFVELFKKFNVEVESSDFQDLIRVEFEKGQFRFSPEEYAKGILKI